MHLLTVKIFVLLQIGGLYKGACHSTKCNVINDVKLFPTKTNVIQSDVALQIASALEYKFQITYYSTNSLWQWHKVNPKTVITFNNCMRSTDNLNLVPKHIMTSLSESLV